MSYLAENLAMFMVEAVDRNGKKDPSLNMKNKSDFIRKHSREGHKAFDDASKSKCRNIKKYSKDIHDVDTKKREALTSNQRMYGRLGPNDNGGSSYKKDYDDKHRKLANDELTAYKSYDKIQKRKAQNESALFNDPIWDTLV